MTLHCQAVIRRSTYNEARPCAMRWGLKKVGSKTLCVHHRKMAAAASS